MIDLNIQTQPDDESCGPTSLHAIYEYYGFKYNLEELIHDIERSYSGGTLAPVLGAHALKQGFNALIYVNNLNLFDPTWFREKEPQADYLIDKLNVQLKYKKTKHIKQLSFAYQNYLQLGGAIRFESLNVQLLNQYFNQNIPVLTGLSATYLYGSARERYNPQGQSFYDDIRGTPCGHFVLLCGYDEQHKHIIVADPHRENPLSHDNYYMVSSTHLINAILLGVLTYDANLLIIQPKEV